jgi:hypothetical protein
MNVISHGEKIHVFFSMFFVVLTALFLVVGLFWFVVFCFVVLCWWYYSMVGIFVLR